MIKNTLLLILENAIRSVVRNLISFAKSWTFTIHINKNVHYAL
jgi:hypothetical protein